MSAEVPANTDEALSPTGQGGLPGTQPPTTPSTPPAPPRNRLVTSIQRMPPGGRWALGAGLAFVAGLAWVLFWLPQAPYLTFVGILVMAVCAVGAGFVLSTWWAVPLQGVAATVGGWVAGVLVQLAPPVPEGGEAFGWFVLAVAPLLAGMLLGTALGQWSGIAMVSPGRAREIVIGGVPRNQWVPAISLVFGGGLLVGLFPLGGGLNPFALIPILFAPTCLAASWLLRSWWGIIAPPVVYVAFAALTLLLLRGMESFNALDFALYIVLPAVVMSVIGTVIGMSRARRAGPPVQHGQLAT